MAAGLLERLPAEARLGRAVIPGDRRRRHYIRRVSLPDGSFEYPPERRVSDLLAWTGKEYVAIRVDQPQLGTIKMGQGMTFIRKDGEPMSHVCGRECGLRG